MTPPSDRGAKAFAALATALGITIGVAPEALFAQSATRPPAAETQKGAVQHKGAKVEAKQGKRLSAKQDKTKQQKAQQLKAQQLKGQQLKGQQLKGQQPKGAQVKGKGTGH